MRKKITKLAIESLIVEVELSPKPGLVDKYCNGSHKDMNIETFYKSANALRVPFEKYLKLGESFKGSPKELFNTIRDLGIEAEEMMFAATNGINTHKGANFMFGILLSAIGYTNYSSLRVTIDTVKEMCLGLVDKELNQSKNLVSNGEYIFKNYNLTGIRGEVEQGFPLVIDLALPYLNKKGISEISLKETLLKLIQTNNDTNMVKRGGIKGLNFGKHLAGLDYSNIDDHLNFMNEEFMKLNLSPGGSADLLAISYFLYNYQILTKKRG